MAARNEAKIRFIAETSEFNEQIKRASQSMTEFRSEMKLSQTQFKGTEQSVDALTDKKRILERQLDASADKVEALRKKLQKAKEIYGENSSEVSKLKTQLNNAERQYVETENAIEDVTQALKKQEKETDDAADATDELDSSMRSASSGGFTVMKGAIANLLAEGIIKLVDGLKDASKYAVKTGMDFEAGMSQVQATSGATTEEMEALTAEAMRVGESTKFSAGEAAEGLNYMAMAGWKADDMLAGLEGMANLAAAANSDLGTASDIVTDTLTAMGYAAGDSARLADVMAAASSNANTNVELMGYTFKYAAPVAGALGYSMEDLAIATGLMANAGIKGEQAGTTLRAGLTNLVSPASTAAAAMDKYGISIKNSDGTVKPLSETMEILRKKLGDLPEAEQAAAASAIFGKEAMSGWLSVINSSDQDFAKLSESIYGSEGAAKRMAATMQDNLKGDVEELGGALDTLSIKVYDKFAPALREGVKAITGFITGTSSASEMVEGLKNAMSKAGEAIRSSLPAISQKGGELMAALVQGLISAIPSIFQCATSIVTGLLDGLASNMGNIFSAGSSLIDKLGQGILSALPKIAESAMNLIDALGKGIKENSKKMAEQGLTLVENLVDHIAEYTPKLIENGIGFIRNLVQGITSSLPVLFEKLPTIISKAANIISDSGPKLIAGGVKIIGDLLIGILKAIPSLLKNIPKILKAIVDVFLAFGWLNFGKGLFTKVGDGIKAAGAWVKNGAVNVFNTVMNALKSIPDKLFQLGKNAITKLGTGIKNAAITVKNAAVNVFNAVINAIKSLPTKLLQLGKDAISKLAQGIKNVASTVKSAAVSIFNTVVNAIKSLPSKLLELGKNAISKLADGIRNVASKVKSAATNVFNTVVNAIKGLPQKLADIGRNLITGLWNGISDKATWLWSKISGFFDGVVSKIKGFFGIKSPSRLMSNEVGRYLAEGVGVGISKNEDAAIAPMKSIVKKIKDVDVSSEWGKLSAGGSLNYDVSSSLGDYVSSAIDANSPYALLGSLIDAVEDLASRAIVLDIDGTRFATATAGASDNVSGNRLNLKQRGLAL